MKDRKERSTLLGATIRSDICPRTLFVTRSRTVFRERSPRKTVSFGYQTLDIFKVKWGLLCLLPVRHFCTQNLLKIWEISVGQFPVLAEAHSVT